MKYEVLVSPAAGAELEEAYQWLAERTENAPEWHNDFIKALISLQENPTRCPVARRDSEYGEEYRQLLFGGKRHSYKILFLIRGANVWIGHVVHAARG